MDIKLFFGILSIIPGFVAYYLYFKKMFAGQTKPHTFSWLVWGILAANGFFAQVSANAGIGAWTTGITSVATFTVFFFSLRMGTVKPTRFDWTILTLALFGLAALLVVEDKTLSLVITLFALLTGFVMTINKAYHKPAEENGTAFLLNALKFLPAIFALSSVSFLTIAYPLVAGLGNVSVWAVVVVRQKQPHPRTPNAAQPDPS